MFTVNVSGRKSFLIVDYARHQEAWIQEGINIVLLSARVGEYLGSKPDVARKDSQTCSIDQIMIFPAPYIERMRTDRTNLRAGMLL